MVDRNEKAKEDLQKKIKKNQLSMTISQNEGQIKALKSKVKNDELRLPLMTKQVSILKRVEFRTVNPDNSLLADSEWMSVQKELNILGIEAAIEEVITNKEMINQKISVLIKQNDECKIGLNVL